MMCQKQIKLNATEEVQEFVKAAGKCDFDIDVFYNRIIIDAKSILGVLSMDLTRVLTVQCHGESKEFNRTLQKFAVAQVRLNGFAAAVRLAPAWCPTKIAKNRYCRIDLKYETAWNRRCLFFLFFTGNAELFMVENPSV